MLLSLGSAAIHGPCGHRETRHTFICCITRFHHTWMSCTDIYLLRTGFAVANFCGWNGDRSPLRKAAEALCDLRCAKMKPNAGHSRHSQQRRRAGEPTACAGVYRSHIILKATDIKVWSNSPYEAASLTQTHSSCSGFWFISTPPHPHGATDKVKVNRLNPDGCPTSWRGTGITGSSPVHVRRVWSRGQTRCTDIYS